MGIKDKVREKAKKDDKRRKGSSEGKDKQTASMERGASQRVGGADQAPNPTKAAEDVD
jgi:hypothetical protein